MSTIIRGFKNSFRNFLRTFSVIFILAISISLTLIMFLSLKTVQAKISEVKSSVGNTVSISSAGIRGFEGGGELLTESDITTMTSIPNVTKVYQVLNDRLTPSQNTSLLASLEPGSFGRRNQSNSNESENPNPATNENQAQAPPVNITMPITVTGVNNLEDTQYLNIGTFKLTSGNNFNATGDENVALVGTDLATKNNLQVGSIFKAYNNDITVVGIFNSENKFFNSSVVMQIKAVQRLSGQTGQINSAVVQVDSFDNLSSVQSALKSKLGEKVDVVSSQETLENAIKPLESIKKISFYSLVGSLIAGSIIIFLVMIMIVRERRREIGVLKAIGASNFKITSQFIVEALVITLIASIIGMVGGFVFSNPVLKALISNSSTTGQLGIPGPGGQEPTGGQEVRGGPGGFMMRLSGGATAVQSTIQNMHTVVGYSVILYGLLAALIIAIIGSAIPAFFISKIRPAEVMRTE